MKKTTIPMILLFFASCTHLKNDIPKDIGSIKITIDKPIAFDKLKASDYVDSIAYVFLETKEDCYVAEITGLYMINDTILIFDRKLNSIIVFSNSGRFIKKIVSRKDLSGGDILNVVQFEKSILVTSNRISDILVFNLNGEKIRQIPSSPFKFSCGAIEPDIFVDFFPDISVKYNKNFHFSIRNSEGKITNQFISEKRSLIGIKGVLQARFYQQCNELHLFSAELSQIFVINKNHIYPSYLFLSGNEKEFPSPVNDGVFEIDNVIESKTYLFIDAIIDKHLYNYVYQKSNNVLKPVEIIQNSRSFIFGILNDVDGIYPVWPIFSINDSLYARTIMPKAVLDYHFNKENDSMLLESSSRKVLEQFRNRKPVENPVIILYKFKNHE